MSRNVLSRPNVKVTVFHGMLTTADRMRDFFRILERVAKSESTVLIRGESGTGKELAARALHELSPRSHGPFRAVNCATFTRDLLASELFGHARGAFTGAIRDREGLFQLADGGTVFLDEIAELPLDLQAQLLRVLQERSFVPVGGTEPINVDVRVVSATHQALRREVEARRFREDLMYRVRVVPLFLPRLVEREGDVAALTWQFIDQFNAKHQRERRGARIIEGIDQRAMKAMCAYPWPGNIRELRNVIEYAFAIGEGPVMTPDDLTPELRGEPVPGGESDMSLGEIERERIVAALREAQGRKADAAEALGMSRSTLWRKLREYHL